MNPATSTRAQRRLAGSSLAAAVCALTACVPHYRPARIDTDGLQPPPDPLRFRSRDASEISDEELAGDATWYGAKFHGRSTANGERFDMYTYTAAHRVLPFNTLVRVTRTDDLRSIVVRVNDRGPFGGSAVIDLAWGAAYDLGIVERGRVPVRLEVVRWGDGAIYR